MEEEHLLNIFESMPMILKDLQLLNSDVRAVSISFEGSKDEEIYQNVYTLKVDFKSERLCSSFRVGVWGKSYLGSRDENQLKSKVFYIIEELREKITAIP